MPRKQKKYHFIYKTTNTITGRYYYGMHSTNDLDDGYLGSGKRLRYSINKYGEANHIREIIEFCKDRSSLILREIEIVNLNEIAKKDCMNLMCGGKGGFISDEQQRRRALAASKASALSRIMNPERFIIANKKASERFKNLHINGIIKYDTFKGRNHTEETRKKISESNKESRLKEKNSQYGTCWIYNLELKKSIKISKDDLSIWFKNGWKKGRKLKY